MLPPVVVIAVLTVPLPDALRQPPGQTPVVCDRHGEVLAECATESARMAISQSLAATGPTLAQVTVSLEDHRFWKHRGVDWLSVVRASADNLRHRRIVSGASTITQQLIKVATGRQSRSWRSKIYEMLAAMKLELRWDKKQILESYLNRCNYGNRLVGAKTASLAYFGKETKHLTMPAAVFLAGLPQQPTRYNPWRYPDSAFEKYSRSLKRLAELGIIDDGRQRLYLANRPRILKRPFKNGTYHFVQALRQQYPHLAGRVVTTLDTSLQRRADAWLDRHLGTLERYGVTQGSIVVIENATGAVRAMVGSSGLSGPEGYYNGCLTHRSSGSTLKPFLYLKAIDDRVLTAASILPDTPDAIPSRYFDFDPRNYDSRHWGPVRVREALASSLNVPAVVAVSKVGAREMFETLGHWGFSFPRTFDEYGAGFILGNAEIRLLDLASSFTAFARNGIAIRPVFVEGEVGPCIRLASPQATRIVRDIISDNAARQKTFGSNSPLAFDKCIPCKTGTSSAFRDAWTVGCTKQHTVGVWVGNHSGRPMHEIGSIRGAAPLWRTVVESLLVDDDPFDPIRESDGVVSRPICLLSGKQPSSFDEHTAREWFLEGTEPDGVCDFHRSVGGKVRIILPDEYAFWCGSTHNYWTAMTQDSDSLAIVMPRPHSQFVIDRALPRSKQVVELLANRSPEASISWFWNGEEVEAEDGRYFKPLEPGCHIVQLLSGEQRVECAIHVE